MYILLLMVLPAVSLVEGIWLRGNFYVRAQVPELDKNNLSQKSMGVALFEQLNFIKNKIETAVFNAYGNNLLGMMGGMLNYSGFGILDQLCLAKII